MWGDAHWLHCCGVCSAAKNAVTFCLSRHPWLQNSANGGDNLAGVGGDSYYGKAGGEPYLQTKVCCLRLLLSASHWLCWGPSEYCQFKQTQHPCLEASGMQLGC